MDWIIRFTIPFFPRPCYLVSDLDEEAESLGGLQHQPSRNIVTEVLRLGARLHLKHLHEHAQTHRSHPTPESLYSCSRGL